MRVRGQTYFDQLPPARRGVAKQHDVAVESKLFITFVAQGST
jgi:hypothetical protein